MISIVRILLLCQMITSLSNYEAQYDDAHELLQKYVISANLLQQNMYEKGLTQDPYPVFGNQIQDARHEPMVQLQTSSRLTQSGSSTATFYLDAFFIGLFILLLIIGLLLFCCCCCCCNGK